MAHSLVYGRHQSLQILSVSLLPSKATGFRNNLVSSRAELQVDGEARADRRGLGPSEPLSSVPWVGVRRDCLLGLGCGRKDSAARSPSRHHMAHFGHLTARERAPCSGLKPAPLPG